MSDSKIGSYGVWNSPITSDLVVMESLTLSEPRVDGGRIYWTEGRPSEGGRMVIVTRSADGATRDLTPIGFDVRSRVHEYGGGSYQIADGFVYFVNFSDQQIYFHGPEASPCKLTSNDNCRYADLQIDRRRNRLVAIREEHPLNGGEAINALVAIDLGTGAEVILHQGYDFYSSPALNPVGGSLAWLCWRHPHMPWISTCLMVAEFDQRGSLDNVRLVAGGPDESIFQPQWSPSGALYFVSDRTDYWNIYRLGEAGIESVLQKEAEFGAPLWQFGMATYAFLSEIRLICAFTTDGEWRLACLDLEASVYDECPVAFASLSAVRAARGRILVRCATAGEMPSINLIDPATWEIAPLKFSMSPDRYGRLRQYFSRPRPIKFPTDDNEIAYGFYYPPMNPDWSAPAAERPPLLVRSHGGPTSATNCGLNLAIQFWTSRGFGVVDVNYRGSAGYGRKYRAKLCGRWGVVDVADCIAAARFLTASGEADPGKLGIMGGSAGGYTTLCALTFHSVFAIGASYYGVSDLAALASETHKFESRYTDWLIEPYRTDSVLYRDRSPIHFVEKLSAPMILFHGEEDRVVPLSQSEKIHAALRKQRIPTALIVFQGERHGFRRPENVRRALEAELLFYAINLIGAPLYA
jgi:dipeptidyl aminopeptidase/acylaminoacyl peptidase